MIPVGAPNTLAALAFLELRVYAKERGQHHGVRAVRDARGRSPGDPRAARPEARERREAATFPLTEEEVADCSGGPGSAGSAEDVAEVEEVFQEVVAG